MKGFRLEDREIGSHFCELERDLIFDKARSHQGWVHYVSSSSFRLIKSKFTDLDNGIVYLLGPDMKHPEEGDFVEIVPGIEERAISVTDRSVKRSDLRFRKYRLINVDSIEPGRIMVPPPLLPRDEFLYRISREWKNASDDMLDTVIALLMVSAPRSVYGRGGIGSEGLEGFRMDTKGSPRDVANTIMRQIPVEFRVPGRSTYKYMPLGSIRDIRVYQRGDNPETNFTIVKPHRVSDTWLRQGMPIQLPFVISDADYRKDEGEFDLDVLDYQLSALYMPPPPSNDIERMAISAVERAHKMELFDIGGVGDPEPMGGLRLALALARLNVGREWKGREYVRSSFKGLSEGEDLFFELLRRGYEEVRDRKMEESYFDISKSLPGREKLKEKDRRIYYALRRRFEEQGIEETPREEILPGENPRLVDESLQRLNRYGYILFMKGGAVIKIVKGWDPGDTD
jgi:hypothetical protein